MAIKGQDIVVALKLLSNETANLLEVGQALSLSASQVHNAVQRLDKLGLVEKIDRRTRRVVRGKLRKFVETVLPDTFPVSPGPITLGMPTAHATPPLSSLIAAQADAFPPVWPTPDGAVRGYELKPIHKCAVFAAKHDAKLYELLALIDAVRSGRAREREIAINEFGARIVESTSAVSARTFVRGRGITEETLNSWAQTDEARSALPDLIRRLVCFLVPSHNIRRVHFPAYAAANQSGFDGEVETLEAFPLFADTRLSVWEIGTGDEIKKKAGDDFKTRSECPLGHTPANETYIALTGRIWRNKHAWLEIARNEKRWASVRAYDATDIAQWLSMAPAVRAWFSEVIGHSEDGFETADQAFRAWSFRTNPQLHKEVVLAGRNQERERLEKWLDGQPTPLVMQADTGEECVVFLCAALHSLANASARDCWLARTLIIRSSDAWKRILRELNRPDAPAMLLIPAFDDFDGSRLGTGGHHLFVPRDRTATLRNEACEIDLRPIDREALAKALDETAFHDARKARSLAYDCGGALSKLQRLLDYKPAAPSWSAESPDLLCAMLLAGAWNPRSGADLDILRRLAGTPDVAPIADLSEKLLRVSDPPLRMQGDVIKWRSARDAWESLSHIVRSQHRLERFVKVATDVLSKRSPRFDLPPNQRLFASAERVELPESKQIRTGLADSVAWLSTFVARQNPPSQLHQDDFAAAANRIVSDVLNDPDWRLWATLNEDLQSLAEGAPKTFLSEAEKAASSRDFAPLFAQDSCENGFFCECSHAGLLWSLEVLAWNPTWFNNVVRILGLLAKIAPGGQYSNRPAKTLEELFGLFARRTWASNEQRTNELERQLAEPDTEPIIWKILLRNLKTAYRGESMDPNHCPKFLDLRDAQGQSISDFVHYSAEETNQMLAHTRELVIRALNQQPLRVLELFQQSLINVMPATFLVWMNARQQAFSQWPLKAKSDLIRQIHVWASGTRKWRPNDVKETVIRGTEAITAQIEKKDPLAHAAWQFCNSIEHSLLLDKAQEDRDAELDQRRMDALMAATQKGSHFESLICIIQAALNPWLVGLTFAKLPTADECTQPILERLPTDDTSFTEFAQAFFLCRGESRLLDVAQHLVNTDKGGVAVCLLLAAPSSPTIRDWLNKQDQAVSSDYWKRITMRGATFRDADDFSSVIGTLLSHGQLLEAFTAVDRAINKDTSTCRSSDLLKLLRAPFAARATEFDSELSQVMSWSVPEIFKTLDARPDVQPQEIAALEILYLDLFRQSDRPARRIFDLLSKQPELFVDFVTTLFKPETPNTETLIGDASANQQAQAHHAFQILHAWSGYPGQGLPPTERDKALRSWCDRVLALTAEADRRIMGEQNVGDVLSRVPPCEEDSAWPCLVAREYLCEGRKQVGSGLFSGLFTTKESRTCIPGDHHVERDQAKRLELDAERIRAKWPETASLLDSMARDYRQWADQLDRHDAEYTDP